MTQARFLNLDLELRSQEDLSDLAAHFETTASVLFNGKTDSEFRLAIETAAGGLEGDTPERCAVEMLSLLEGLPSPLIRLLDQCGGRVFDFGFESGSNLPPFSVDLSSATLKRIVGMDLTVRTTIYPAMNHGQ